MAFWKALTVLCEDLNSEVDLAELGGFLELFLTGSIGKKSSNEADYMTDR